MDYVEWVEKVLHAAVQAQQYMEDISYAHNGMNFRQIGGELGFQAEGLESSEATRPAKAVLNALTDLAALGLVEEKSSGFFRLTREGRRAAQVGLSSLWADFVSTPLDEDQKATLTKIVQEAQVDCDTYVALKEVVVWDMNDLPIGTNEGMRIIEVVQELDDKYHMLRKRGRAGLVKARPTYVGDVRLTRQVDTEKQAHIRNLLTTWEGVNVDFKRELKLNTKSEKAEFVRDILALVNTRFNGERNLVIGFDPKTQQFYASVDQQLTSDQMEDILGAYTSPVPTVHYYRVPWANGTVGLIEIDREPHKLPYKVKVDVADKVKAGDVFVRHGSHTVKLKPNDEEYQDLVAEGDRARLT
ncbi:MAG TPA: ATP-binding protein [Chloroflexia bacterium]|jgi:hypothetical protein